MTLKKYHQKRDFEKTLEPKGRVVKPKKVTKLKYLIQKHAASHLHYDFRLELNGVLLSWAVPKGPCLDPSIKRLAMHVEDHPLEYGSFEGTIPKGQYGGGTVMLWDHGEWIPDEEDVNAAYRKGSLKFQLKGKRLQGGWKLIRMNKDDKTWLLIKAKDKYAKPLAESDILLDETKSVTTKRSMNEIAVNAKPTTKSIKKKTNKPEMKLNLAQTKFPNQLLPELATLVDKPPAGQNWLHEIKFDGYRLLAFKKGNKTTLRTRNDNNWTSKFESIVEAIHHLTSKDIILDGEVVVLDENQKSNFQLLQNGIKLNDDLNMVYYVFDLLYYDKYDLRGLPLSERKAYLKTLIPTSEEIVRYSDHVTGSGNEVFTKSCELGLEGIVSKEADSLYSTGRNRSWLKVKCIKRQEFIIGGYTKPQNSRQFFGSLLIGTHNEKGELIYNGHVGTGFTAASLKFIHALLSKYKSNENPFNVNPPRMKHVTWVKPVLIAEIEFTEWTQDNILRHPSFKGLRSDKKPKNIIHEVAMPIETVNTKKVSHPDKILYPEDNITKQGIADYYDCVSEWILPYIADRPLTLLRCPDGYKSCFFQKHYLPSFDKSLHSIDINDKKTLSKYIYLDDKAGLLSLIQLGVLEIHPWGSHIGDLENPDMVIFDLDPAPDVPWKNVVKAAFDVKQQLKDLSLESFVKTTGGKGLHVVVPIKAEYEWVEVKNFSHTFVKFMTMNNPTSYIDKMSKAERKGKIFLDYLRNQRGATAVAAYSARAREHAPVSTPVHWDELTNKIQDTFYTILTIPKRLEKLSKDPWEKFYKIHQSLNLKKYR